MHQCSTTTRHVATVSIIYVGACVVYLMLTQGVGTPLKDSFTEEQIRLKEESMRVRGTIFVQSVGISALVVLCCKPFRSNHAR